MTYQPDFKKKINVCSPDGFLLRRSGTPPRMKVNNRILIQHDRQQFTDLVCANQENSATIT